MKLLADMPISPKTVAHLRSLGNDVYRISEKGLYKAKDHDIIEIAVRENRVILTMDLDFAAILKGGDFLINLQEPLQLLHQRLLSRLLPYSMRLQKEK